MGSSTMLAIGMGSSSMLAAGLSLLALLGSAQIVCFQPLPGTPSGCAMLGQTCLDTTSAHTIESYKSSGDPNACCTLCAASVCPWSSSHLALRHHRRRPSRRLRGARGSAPVAHCGAAPVARQPRRALHAAPPARTRNKKITPTLTPNMGFGQALAQLTVIRPQGNCF